MAMKMIIAAAGPLERARKAGSAECTFAKINMMKIPYINSLI